MLFRNDKSLTYSEKYSVTAGIMTAVIIVVSYIIPNISFNFLSDSWAKQRRMSDVCWISSGNCTFSRLKIRSQKALVLMKVALDNSPISQSLQRGKIDGVAALKCHEGTVEISVALLTLICLLLFPSGFHWMPTMKDSKIWWREQRAFWFSFFFFSPISSLRLHFLLLPLSLPYLFSLCVS